MASKSGETSPYKANKGGEIASPNTDSVVTNLVRGHKNSLKTNEAIQVGGAGSPIGFNRKGTIETPATDQIANKGKVVKGLRS